MSARGPGDMREVEQTTVLFVQRGDIGPPGGSAPGSPDQKIIIIIMITCERVYQKLGQIAHLFLHKYTAEICIENI